MAEVAYEGNGTALFNAFIMIVVSEIGDKTFLIAAVMAARHARITVFLGAFGSLVIMSILSAALGRVILGLIPKVWTLWAAALLFLVFGLKMIQEALSMRGGSSHIQEEMREVEEELEEDTSFHDSQNARGSTIPLEALEEGKAENGNGNGHGGSPRRYSRSHSPRTGPSINFPLSHPLSGSSGKGSEKSGKHWTTGLKEGARRSIQLTTNPVFAQAFILTFLGEWGDRSQITTIAMGGAHSIPVIAFGTILGHGLCTFGAVMGGRYLSTKISVKHITSLGAAAFMIFALMYAYEALQTPWGFEATYD